MAWPACLSSLPDLKMITLKNELQNKRQYIQDIPHDKWKKTKVVWCSHISRKTMRTCDLVKVNKQDRDDQIQEADLWFTISYVTITKNGNTVKRNIWKWPKEKNLHITAEEWQHVQDATSKSRRREEFGRRNEWMIPDADDCDQGCSDLCFHFFIAGYT